MLKAHDAGIRTRPRRTMKSAVIGTGRIAIEHLRFLKNQNDVDIVAVCDLSPALAEYAAKQFGAQNAITDYPTMLRTFAPDVVHVCTPAATHASVARDCLSSGSNVIVEKPIASCFDEFENLWEMAQVRGLLITEDHNYLFNPPIPEMKEIIAEGTLGAVKEIEVRAAVHAHSPGNRYADVNLPHASHALPAGVIHEFITHMCYLVHHFLPDAKAGVDFQQATAFWNNHGGENSFKFDDLDAVIVTHGVHVHLRFCSSTYPPNLDIAVRCSNGSMYADVWHPYLRIERPSRVRQLSAIASQWSGGWGLVRSSLRNLRDRFSGVTTYEGLSKFLSLTYDAIRTGGTPPVGYDEISATCKMIDDLVSRAETK